MQHNSILHTTYLQKMCPPSRVKRGAPAGSAGLPLATGGSAVRMYAWIALLVACLAPAKVGSAVTLGVVSDFESGDQGWGSGGGSIVPNPNPPVVETNGGPAGAGDAFLRVIANGGGSAAIAPAYDGGGVGGSGSKLVVFNESSDWIGDYASAGVAAIEFDIKNLTLAILSIRVQIEGTGDIFVTSAAQSLPALADWTRLRIPIGAGDLTGGRDLDAVLSNVTRIRIMHNPSATSSTLAPPIAAQIGIDNVTAAPVPEPSMALLTGAGLLVLAATRRRPGAWQGYQPAGGRVRSIPRAAAAPLRS